MNANELMIGDWVMAFPDKCRVDGIICLREVHTADEKWMAIVHLGGNKYEQVNIGILEPIPLTPEIFEKSGFTLNEEENPILTIRVYSLDADDVAVIQRPKGGWKFMYGKETSNQQDLFFGDGKFVCTPIQYVHELQHALRLAGIKKEIVL